jgi:hypothetical protein
MVDDVPILIETLSRPFFPMVRCLYLAVEFEIPDNGWFLQIGSQLFPFLMLGLTGVVQASIDAEPFHGPQSIDSLIDLVEASNGLVSFEDIWLPQELFSSKLALGDVYRVSTALFGQAFRFRDSRLSEERFRSLAQDYSNQIEFSTEETGAFRSWSSGTMERIAHARPKDERLQLVRKAER